MFLITYECQNRKVYDTCENVVDWLLSVNGYDDAPYFILNVVELTESEHRDIDGAIIGM